VNAPRDPLAGNSRLRQLALASVFVAALVLSCFQVTDLDLGGHVTVGREILKNHRIPSTNFFSHTFPDHPYPVHQWLGQVILFAVGHVAGPNGLILGRMVVVLLGTLLLYRNIRREGAPVVVASALVLLLLVAARPRFFERPFLATFVFLPLLHSFVANVREGRTRTLWPVVALMTVWAHVHSGVLFGALYLGATVVGEGIKILSARGARRHPPGSHIFPGSPLDGWNYRRLVLFSLAAVALPAATMAAINPSGIRPLVLPLVFWENQDFRRMILEYREVKLGVDWPWELVAGAVLAGVALRPRRVDLTQLLVTVGFGVLAFQAVREIITFAAAAAPLLGRTWGLFADDSFAWLARGRRGKELAGPTRGEGGARAGTQGRGGDGHGLRRANLAEACVAVAIAGASAAVSVRATQDWVFPFGFGWDERHYPQRALDFLWAQNARGPIFNTDAWSSALLWRGKGRRFPVFVDARLEAYPESFWPDVYYRVLRAAPGWEDVLDRFGVQCAMLNRAPNEVDDAIGRVLLADERWGVAYWNDAVMILLRRDGPSVRNREILEEWEFESFSPRHPEDVKKLRGDALREAVAELQQLVAWEGESFLPRWALAAAWTRLGRGEEAADLFARLARRREARDNAPFERSRAEAELVNGRRDRWAQHLEAAGADPAASGELFAAAQLLSDAGHADSAMAAYREVLAADPAHGDARNNLALLLARGGDGDEARTLIDEALRAAPGDPYYVASRGEIRLLAGDRAGALADFQHALDLLPAGDAAAREEVMRWILRLE
jgi:tetratricopeptide (TPR) repeat protein